MATPKKPPVQIREPRALDGDPHDYCVISTAQLQHVYNVLATKVTGTYVELDELLAQVRGCYTLDEYLP